MNGKAENGTDVDAVLMPWTQPLCPLQRMFAEGALQRQWSQSASLSSHSSQISDASSSGRLPQNTADTDASMSELASSDACLSRSSSGSDVVQ